MTRNHERELATLLTGGPLPEPPADLAAKIAAEIPDTIELHPNLAADYDATVVPLRRRRTPWLAAAAAVLTLSLTAAVTWQLRDSRPQVKAIEETATPRNGSERAAAPHDLLKAAVDPDGEASPESTAGGRDTGRADDATTAEASPTMQRMTAVNGPQPKVKDEAAAAEAVRPQELRSYMRSMTRSEPAPTAAARPEVAQSAGKLTLGLADGAAASGDHKGQPERRSERQQLYGKVAGQAVAPAAATPGPAKTADKLKVTAQMTVIDTARPAADVPPGYFNEVNRDYMSVVEVPAPPSPPEAPPSTGGTTEPNDAAYGDVFFRNAGVNPFVDTDDDALSTFGLEVDTGSFNVVKRYLADGNLPPSEAVRVEELINAFDYGDRPPRRGDFALTAEGGPTPFAENDRYRLVRFAIKAREVDASRRPPATLVFVIDVSGSMDRENRLGLVKQALAELLAELRPDDRVGLVIYGSRGEVLLDPTSDLERVRRAIDRLHAGGSTNAEQGLVLGYQLAADNLQRGRISRVILCSDGVANVGRTGPESILAQIERDVERGIELTAVGFGMGNYNDALMERLADTGDGRYAYVDTLDEARRIFVEELTGTLYTVAREAKAQVEFDPAAVSRWRLLGYENRAIADERFRDPTVDAGEIGAGHTVTALYEVKLAAGARRRDTLATLRVRYRPAESERPVELAERLAVGDLARRFSDASPAFRLAASVAELAELLKGAYWARGGSLDSVLDTLHDLDRDFYRDPRFDDLVAMAREARTLLAQRQRDTAPEDDGDR